MSIQINKIQELDFVIKARTNTYIFFINSKNKKQNITVRYSKLTKKYYVNVFCPFATKLQVVDFIKKGMVKEGFKEEPIMEENMLNILTPQEMKEEEERLKNEKYDDINYRHYLED